MTGTQNVEASEALSSAAPLWFHDSHLKVKTGAGSSGGRGKRTGGQKDQ